MTDVQLLTAFFMWCSIINGALLVLWTVLLAAIPDCIYHTQNRWFPLPRETFNVLMYSFLGLFKIFFLVFNLVPYLALLLAG